MGAEKEILEFLVRNPDGASISDISGATGHTRATVAKYLELMRLQNQVSFREVGKAKLWVLAHKKKKVLIAEDEDHIRRLIRVILEPDGYFFAEAKDGIDALEKVSEEMPDLIILDLMMSKMNGIEVCRQLKKNALTRKIPVIMLTAKREMSDKVAGIKAGADDYLTKPFEPRELRVRVKTFLDREKKERNQITNLPTMGHSLSRLKSPEKDSESYYLFFKNLDLYRKDYGFSKTNELIRLTSQIIAHTLERIGMKNFIGHDDANNFIIITESRHAKQILKEIKDEFESTIPFFYEVDYENIDFRNNAVSRRSIGGKMEKVPLVQLGIGQLNGIGNADLSEKLMQLRGG